jgi:hypothetical protein
LNGFVGWIFGEDQNQPPNVNQDTDAVKAGVERRLQAVSSQLDVLHHKDPAKGVMQENVDMKNRIQELENEQRALRQQLTQADEKKRQQSANQYQQPDRVTRRATDWNPGAQVPQTSMNGAMSSGGRLSPYMKVRYNSASANRWLPAVVDSFNESNGTYNLDIRPQADPVNISPDPLVKVHEAWPEGTLVSYQSSTAGRSLDAIIISFVEGTGGINGTYNLDVRECADVDRIRPRCR